MFKTKNLVRRVYTHTDSFYLDMSKLVELYESKKGKKTREEASKFLDEFDKRYIQKWIREISNKTWQMCNGVNDCIFFDREKICHMILAGKAKYALDIIDDEGKYSEDLNVKITGLEIKRSDTPKLIREKLDEAISIMFDNDNEKLINFMEDFKKEYYNEVDIDKVALPSGVSNITKYESGKQKSTPIHVRSSLNYNKFLDKHELTKDGYQKISDGEKIKWFRLKKNPYINDNVLAFNDVGIFKQFDILKYFDYEEMYERTFYRKVKSLCEVVGMDISFNEQLSNDLF